VHLSGAARAARDDRADTLPELTRSMTLAACTALWLTTAASPARADSQQTTPTGATQAPAPILVADASPKELGEITVSARRRSEKAQDVPIPIAVVSGDDLDAAGRFRVENLNEELPSTNIEYVNPRQTSIAVRGLGNNPANDALESSVGVYVDDVYLGRSEMINADLLDIDQVTLQRGPQGTLFGKNTVAGVLNITTNAPAFTPWHDVEASYGDYGYYQARGTWNQPLTDEVAVRFSAVKTFEDGFVRDTTTGLTLNGSNRSGGRAQLLWKPSDTFSIRFIADYSEEHSDTGASVLYNPGPNGGAKYYAALAAADATVIYSPSYDYTTINSRQQMNVTQGGGSGELNWDIGDYRLTAITAYRSWSFVPYNDGDFTNLNAITDAGQLVDDNQWSQEIRLASPADRPVSYVVGAYYFNQHQDNLLQTQYGSDSAAILDLGLGAPAFANGYTQTTQLLGTYSESAFGQLTWRPASAWELTFGARDTNERKTVSMDRNSDGSVAFVDNANFAGRTLNNLSLDNNGISGLLSASYKFDPNVLGYLSLSRGTESGGINPTVPVPGLSLAQLYVKPEIAYDAELGLKSTLLDRRLVLNADLFWTDVSNYQATLLVQPNASGTFVQLESNIGMVRTRGVETDITAIPVTGLNLRLAASLNDARYLSYTDAPCSAEELAPYHLAPSAKTCDLTGRPVVGAPRWILNPSASYEYPLPSGLSAEAFTSYSWRTWFYGSADDSEYGRVPSYGLLDVRFILHGGDDGDRPWSLAAWCNNALDKRYVVGGLTVSSALYSYTEIPGLPRTFGVTANVSF
jgi:iron complex outermembrane recepter protein